MYLNHRRLVLKAAKCARSTAKLSTCLPMRWVKPEISSIGSDHFANCATATGPFSWFSNQKISGFQFVKIEFPATPKKDFFLFLNIFCQNWKYQIEQKLNISIEVQKCDFLLLLQFFSLHKSRLRLLFLSQIICQSITIGIIVLGIQTYFSFNWFDALTKLQMTIFQHLLD